MRKDELRVEVNGFLVVGGGRVEFGEDEVELGSVIEDVRVVCVVLSGEIEVAGGFITLACKDGQYWGLTHQQIHTYFAPNACWHV